MSMLQEILRVDKGTQIVQWISVDDELPSGYANVLLGSEDAVLVGYYDPKQNRFASRLGSSQGYVLSDITHWMDYPEPPSGETA